MRPVSTAGLRPIFGRSTTSKAASRTTKAAPAPRRAPARTTRTIGLATVTAVAVAIVAGAALWFANGGRDELAGLIAELATETSMAMGLTVQEVTVRGRRQVASEAVVAALGVSGGEPILGFDPAAARTRLLALDWVEKAKIVRFLPSTIHVEITERRAFALWQEHGSLALIDRSGTVLTRTGLDRFANLPMVVGAGAAGRARTLLDLLAAEPDLLAQVQAAVLVAGRRWDVRLANGIKVMLPDVDMSAAWRRLGALEREHAILGRDIDVIDLRIADRLVVRLSKSAAARRQDPGEST